METNESSITHCKSGSIVFTGPDAILWFKAINLKGFLKLYMETGISPTRGIGIKKMLELTTQFTGKTYKLSEQEKALQDLEVWCSAMKSALTIIDERRK